MQFAYLLLVGSFPFNSFLAGFFSCVGFFVLTGEVVHQHFVPRFRFVMGLSPDDGFCAVCLRMQIDPANADFKDMSPERAFADYVLCNALLHLVIWNFMG